MGDGFKSYNKSITPHSTSGLLVQFSKQCGYFSLDQAGKRCFLTLCLTLCLTLRLILLQYEKKNIIRIVWSYEDRTHGQCQQSFP